MNKLLKSLMIPLFFSCSVLYSQQDGNKTDSLESLVKVTYNASQKAKAFTTLARHYYSSDYNKAIAAFDSAIIYHKKTEGISGLANVYGELSALFYSQGNYSKALENNLECLKLHEKLKNNTGVAKTISNIANIYFMQGELKKAEEGYSQALGIYKGLNDRNGEAITLISLAEILEKNKKLPEAINLYNKCITIFDSLKNNEGLADGYFGIGNVLRLQNENDKSLVMFLKALELFNSAGNADKSIAAMAAIADTYMEKGDYQKAIEYNESFFRKASQMRSKLYQKSAMEGLAKAHAALGNFERAYGYSIMLSRIKDTLYSQSRSKQMTDMQVKYETEKKERENKVLQQTLLIQDLEIGRKNNFLIGSLILALLVILFAALFVRQNRMAVKQKTVDLEQKVLRAQMNPHFIFNSLIAIQSFIYRNDAKRSGDYLSDFAKLMRLILENSREESISIKKEIQTLDLYLRLQQLRFDNKFDYKIEVDESFDSEMITIPPMLTQPFIENSIEHGLRHLEKEGLITVNFKLDSDTLRICVTDNGIGMKKAAEIKEKNGHKSLATTITQERLAILNKGAGKKISLAITELNDTSGAITGTKVEFGVPFRKV